MKFNLEFRLEAETKGALRYSEKLPDGNCAKSPNDFGARIGTLYLRKSAILNTAGTIPEWPATINVEVSF